MKVSRVDKSYRQARHSLLGQGMDEELCIFAAAFADGQNDRVVRIGGDECSAVRWPSRLGCRRSGESKSSI